VRTGTLTLLLATFSMACFGHETVYLSSGFTLTVDSHTESDGMYVLRVGNGTLEYPANQVSSIVAVPDVRPIVPAQSATHKPVEPSAILASAAHSEGVDEIFVRAVAKVESGLRQQAVSKKGALGLMQLMPGTAAELGVDPKQADQNASGGARYLRTLLERYGYNPVLTLAAYNAGPGAVSKYHGLPPYYETRTYVIRVLKEYERQLRVAGVSPETVGRQSAAKTPSATD